MSAKRNRKIVLPWHRGIETLSKGYTVNPMEQSYCYRIDRPSQEPVSNPDGSTVAYHVCLWPTCLSCDCPDFAQHGDHRPCKHILAAYVQVWRWALLLGPVSDLSAIVADLGITKLYEAFVAYEERAGATAPLISAEALLVSTEAPLISTEAPLTPGMTITTPGGRTAIVRPAADYGRSRWARQSANELATESAVAA